jgi:endonuclease/exonuclease/phosphatase family metal-dependent hydrolase
LKPDIAILQEVRPECLSYAALGERALWIGDPGQKGLAVVAYGDWSIRPAAISIEERWFLPVVATNGRETVHIVAVWVDSSKECTGPTLRALEALGDFIRSEHTIVTGDFNQCVALDSRKAAGRRFSDVLAAFERLEMTSAWHTLQGEAHGQESAATLYWTWNEAKPFHIDFAFSRPGLEAAHVSLGTYEQYVGGRISDHVPLVVNYG